MFNFVELDLENIVLRVVVGDDINWCEEHLGGRWIQVQKTENKNLPSIGWTSTQIKITFLVLNHILRGY